MAHDAKDTDRHAGPLHRLASALWRRRGWLLFAVLFAATGAATTALIRRMNTTERKVAGLLADCYDEGWRKVGPVRSRLIQAGLMDRPKPPDHDRITDELAALGKPAVPYLLRAVEQGRHDWAATVAMGKIGAAAAPAAPALIRSLRAPLVPDVDFGPATVYIDRALIGIGSEDQTGYVVSELERALGGDNERERIGAAWVLAGIHKEGRPTAPVLIRAVQNRRSPGRAQAVGALAVALRDRGDSPEAAPGVATLIRVLERDEDDAVRRRAAWALGTVRPTGEAAVGALLGVLSEGPGKRLGRRAAEALGRIGPPANVAVPVLLEAVERRAPWWGEATKALSRIGPPRRSDIPAVKLALFTCDNYVRFHAARGLAAHGVDSPEVVTALLETCMTGRSTSARAAAEEALNGLGHYDVREIVDMVGWALADDVPRRSRR